VKILDRYVLKEHVGPLLFALTTLTSLLLLNYIAKQFGNLVGKGLAWTVIMEFFLLSIPFTVAMTLPMAVLVSTLYAFSRLAAENEITALKAGGVSLAKTLVPVLWGATFLAGLMLAFNDQILPRANHRLRVLQGDIARKKPTFALREQVINEVQPGKFYLKAGHLDEGSNRMREVVIYDLSVPTRRRTIYADSGDMRLAPNRRDLALTLYQGYMQELDRTDPGQLQRLFYTVNNIRIPNVANNFEKSENDEFKSDRERTICEMQALYEEGATDRARARFDLETAVANSVREATGRPALRRTFSPSRPPFSLGGAYCKVLALFGGVPEAQAAQSPGSQTTGSPIPFDPRARRRDSLRQRRLDEQRRQAAGDTARVAAPVPGQATRKAPSTTGKSLQFASDSVNVDPPGAVIERPAAAAQGGTRAPVTTPPSEAIRRGESGPIDLTPPSGANIESAALRIADGVRTMNTYEVEIQKKFALAVACVVFVLLGAPIALRFPRGGVGLTIGVSLIVFAIYYIGLIAGEAVADRGILPPFWAMWTANILFTAVGLVLLARMGREGSTSRGGDAGELIDQARVWVAKQLRKVGVPVDRRRRRA
jgi:lipopolysaccharide export system permease protein